MARMTAAGVQCLWHTGFGVFQLEILVPECGAIDRHSTRSIASSNVARLAHELGDDAVEYVALVVQVFACATADFACAELPKVF